MVQVRALRPLYGDYGKVAPDAVFAVSEEVATELEKKGVICRVFETPKIQQSVIDRIRQMREENQVVKAKVPERPAQVIEEPKKKRGRPPLARRMKAK